MQKITPFPWFDNQAEADFYTVVFNDSEILNYRWPSRRVPCP